MPASSQLGFRILAAPAKVPDALVHQFAGMASANLADAMGRYNFMDPGILPRSGLPLCGRAVTVYARPGDNLMVHKAMQVAEPGDILVINTGGNTNCAVFGGMMCTAATEAKLGGIIVDGAIRDVGDLIRLKFPAFSRTVCAGSCDKDGPGEINTPVSCGGAVVMAGDIVVGDMDGVAVVPRDRAAEVLDLVKKVADMEKNRIAEILAGKVFKPEIDEVLRKKGVIA